MNMTMQQLSYDPYAIWVTKLSGLEVIKTPARLMAYADNDYKTAFIQYLDGTRGVVKKEQMSMRLPKHMLEN